MGKKNKAFDHSKYKDWIDPNECIPYERNAKQHTPRQVENIVNSIRRFGWQQDVVITSDNVLVIGHGRRLAALQIGCEMPYHRIDKAADELTDKDIRELRIADNQTNAETGLDFDLLNIEIEDLDFEGFDFDFGIDTEEQDEEPIEIVEDELPTETETRCKVGDLWQLGEHRLICGDSTDIAVIDRLMDGVKADMVFTDPPYQLDTQGGGILKSANSMKQIKKNGVDSFDPSRLIMWSDTNIFCHNKPLIKAYIELAENNNMPYDLAFYKKKNTVPNYKGHLMTDVEYIAIIGKQDPNKGLEKEMYSKCFIGQKDNDNELSYSKPVALCAKYIQLYSKQTVLDLFGGSGSTLIACEQLNRKCYMAELDPHYCDVIIQRWENLTGKKAVLLNDAA